MILPVGGIEAEYTVFFMSADIEIIIQFNTSIALDVRFGCRISLDLKYKQPLIRYNVYIFSSMFLPTMTKPCVAVAVD